MYARAEREMRSKLKDFSPSSSKALPLYLLVCAGFLHQETHGRMTVESDTFSLRSQSLDNFTAMNHAASV